MQQQNIHYSGLTHTSQEFEIEEAGKEEIKWMEYVGPELHGFDLGSLPYTAFMESIRGRQTIGCKRADSNDVRHKTLCDFPYLFYSMGVAGQVEHRET